MKSGADKLLDEESAEEEDSEEEMLTGGTPSRCGIR